jgi:CRP-like cAMP-binding protein
VLDDTKTIETGTGIGVGSVPTGNRLLGSLPPHDLAALGLPRGMDMTIPGQVLLQPSEAPAEILFPGHGTVLTLLALMPDRKPVETAMIGCEGAAGALFGPQPGPFGFRIQVLTSGPLVRVPADRFGEMMALSAPLRATMGRYVSALLAQVQVGVACAALHPVEARAARWLLDLQDRLGERALPLTQEALADLLGVRRTTITRVVAALEARGVVRHRRGRIIVMDRAGLEQTACACHTTARERFECTAPGLHPASRGTGPA